MKSEIIKRIFFPKRCFVCGELIPIERRFCNCGEDRYDKLNLESCEHCGSEKCVCGFENAVKLSHITAPFVYSYLAKQRLCNLKFSGEKNEAEFFGEEMSFRFAQVFVNAKADMVTFVPMRPDDEKERGYNQSELLAQSVARHLFLPKADVLVKNKDSVCQHTLSQKERLENLKDTFEVKNKSEVYGKTIILCDDIKTTGTTLKRCSDELFACGAKDVYCLCAAVSDFLADF